MLKPLARETAISHPGAVFREGLALGQLRYMRCRDCDAPQTLAPYACRRCGSTRLAWSESAMKGTVHAVTTVALPPSEEFRAMAPYTLVLVDLQEGARLMGHGQADLAIGDEVIASFEELGTRGIVFFRRGANPVCTSQTNEGA